MIGLKSMESKKHPAKEDPDYSDITTGPSTPKNQVGLSSWLVDKMTHGFWKRLTDKHDPCLLRMKMIIPGMSQMGLLVSDIEYESS